MTETLQQTLQQNSCFLINGPHARNVGDNFHENIVKKKYPSTLVCHEIDLLTNIKSDSLQTEQFLKSKISQVEQVIQFNSSSHQHIVYITMNCGQNSSVQKHVEYLSQFLFENNVIFIVQLISNLTQTCIKQIKSNFK